MLMLEFNIPISMKTAEKRVSINCLFKISPLIHMSLLLNFIPMQKKLVYKLETKEQV